jgi:hypothetical protein
MPVLDLLPKSLLSSKSSTKFRSSPALNHSREWSGDSSSSGLLSPNISSRRHYQWRKTRRKSALWCAGALLAMGALVLWWYSGAVDAPLLAPARTSDTESLIVADNGGKIPIGKSVERGGREVFWWEEFERYDMRPEIPCALPEVSAWLICQCL